MSVAPDLEVFPGGLLHGRMAIPGDKSISHRAAMLAAVASDESRLTGFLESADCLATLDALRSLGAGIERSAPGCFRIQGVGPGGLRAVSRQIDLGNSGTALRLLAGLVASHDMTTTLGGDASLCQRPMERIAIPLRAMGAQVETVEGHAPVTVHGKRPLRAIRYELPVPSAQVKSAILLAALGAAGTTCVVETEPTRDHTERMLKQFGVDCNVAGHEISLYGPTQLSGAEIAIPGDFSSAAFPIVGASIAPGSELVLESVGINPRRTGLLVILQEMGAAITLENEHEIGPEPVADIRIRGTALRGVKVAPSLVASAIDEMPALAVAAACAEGVTVVTGASELRFKESDRIEAIVAALTALGVQASSFADGFSVTGRVQFEGARVHSRADHRIAMAFAMAGLRSTHPIVIDDCSNIATSFPGFIPQMRAVGLDLRPLARND